MRGKKSFSLKLSIRLESLFFKTRVASKNMNNDHTYQLQLLTLNFLCKARKLLLIIFSMNLSFLLQNNVQIVHCYDLPLYL